MFDIFEKPWGLLTLAVVTSLTVLALKTIWPKKYRRWHPALPLALMVAAFAVDWLVRTDLEKIRSLTNTGVKAVEAEDIAAIEKAISQDYQDSFHPNKEFLIKHCRAMLVQPLIKKAYKSILSIELIDSSATVTLTVRTVFDKESWIYEFKPLMLIKARISIEKNKDNTWLVTNVEILEIDKQPISWKQIKY